MTVLQTLEMALEALKKLYGVLTVEETEPVDHAIKSLRQAIEQQPADEPVAWQLSPTDIYDFAGWLTTRKGVMTVGSSCEAGPMAEAVGEYLKTFPERFNTRPQPAAQWVGLSDEEAEKMAEQVGMFVDKYGLARDAENGFEDGVDIFGFARAIEAKLKEKNAL